MAPPRILVVNRPNRHNPSAGGAEVRGGVLDLNFNPTEGEVNVIPTRITAQGCEISSMVRTQAEELAQRWPRFDPAVMEVSFVFGMEGRDHTSEAIVSRRRRQAVVASGQGPDFRVALDELDGHMTRILRKDRQKRKAFRNS